MLKHAPTLIAMGFSKHWDTVINPHWFSLWSSEGMISGYILCIQSVMLPISASNLPYRDTENTRVACETAQCSWQYARTLGVLCSLKVLAGQQEHPTWTLYQKPWRWDPCAMSNSGFWACQQILDIINLRHFRTFVNLDAMTSGEFE